MVAEREGGEDVALEVEVAGDVRAGESELARRLDDAAQRSGERTRSWPARRWARAGCRRRPRSRRAGRSRAAARRRSASAIAPVWSARDQKSTTLRSGSHRAARRLASRQRSRSSVRRGSTRSRRRPRRRELVVVAPGADGEPGEERGAERRRLAHRRHLDRALGGVGERLHERRVGGHAAVDAEPRDRDARVGLGRLDQVGAAVGDALEHRAHDLGAAGAAREPEQRCRARRSPTAACRAQERRHVPDVAGVVALRRDLVRLSAALVMTPRSSRSHSTLVPADSMIASRPHVSVPPTRRHTIGNVPPGPRVSNAGRVGAQHEVEHRRRCRT